MEPGESGRRSPVAIAITSATGGSFTPRPRSASRIKFERWRRRADCGSLRPMRLGCFALVAFVALAACSPGPTGPDVLYESGATDEAWQTIVDATPVVDDALAPRLVTPIGSVPRSGAPPLFEWDGGSVAAPMAWAPAPRARDVWGELSRAMFPVARAHELPVTGPMYALSIEVPGGGGPVEVLTGATSYTPSAATWARMNVATGPLTIEIVGAYFLTGRITEGPYVSTRPAVVGLE